MSESHICAGYLFEKEDIVIKIYDRGYQSPPDYERSAVIASLNAQSTRRIQGRRTTTLKIGVPTTLDPKYYNTFTYFTVPYEEIHHPAKRAWLRNFLIERKLHLDNLDAAVLLCSITHGETEEYIEDVPVKFSFDVRKSKPTFPEIQYILESVGDTNENPQEQLKDVVIDSAQYISDKWLKARMIKVIF